MKAALAFCSASVVLAIGTSACGPEAVDFPTPPLAEETMAMVQAYDMPTGTLDTARVTQVAEEVRARIDELDIDWLPEVMSRVLVRLQERFDAGGLPDDPEAPPDSDRGDITAVVEVLRVCPGWIDPPPDTPDELENGSIRLTALVDHTRIERLLWGTATDCRWRLDLTDGMALSRAVDPTINAILDGTLILYLYGALPREGGNAAFFMRFTGELGREEMVRQLSFDFRVLRGQIEVRHPVEDGDVIVGFGLGTFSLRGKNASYTCDLATLSCN